MGFLKVKVELLQLRNIEVVKIKALARDAGLERKARPKAQGGKQRSRLREGRNEVLRVQ